MAPFFAYPGNFFDNLGNAYQVTSDRTFVPGITRFNFAPLQFLSNGPDKRYTAGGFANFDLSGAVQPYAEVMYMNDRSLGRPVHRETPGTPRRSIATIRCCPISSDR